MLCSATICSTTRTRSSRAAPRNSSGIPPEQRRAIVEDAHRLIREGMAATRAATEAGAGHGVSKATVYRWARDLGNPLNQSTATVNRRRIA